MATVWGHQSAAGGAGVYGAGLLFGSPRKAVSVCFDPSRHDVHRASVRVVLEHVSHGRLAQQRSARLSVEWLWSRHFGVAGVDDYRMPDTVSQSERHSGRSVAAIAKVGQSRSGVEIEALI